MDFKHRRGHFLIIFEKISEIPILLLSIIFSAFLLNTFDTQALIPVVAILLSPISKLVNYFFTYYTLTQEHLIVESGVFNKKRIELPFSTITAVDLSQNILYQIFGVYKIKVDNASQTNEAANQSKINLTLKKEEAIQFKKIITGNFIETANEQHELAAIKGEISDFIKLGLLQSKAAYIMSILAIVGSLSSLIIPFIEGKVEGALLAALIITIIIIVYLTAVIMSIVKAVIKYYAFSVWADEETLKVQYGLLNKKSFSLQKSKINGIILKQNLLMRIFKLYSAEVIVIGYGDKSEEGGTEKAIIFPIAKKEKIKEIVNIVLPEYSLDYKLCKPERKAIRYFFISPMFIFAVICVICAVAAAIIIENYIVIAAALVFLAFSVAHTIQKYINAGISVGESNIVLSSGAFSKRVAIIKTKSIESITSTGSIFKRRKGFVSIRLGFVAPLRVANISSLNLPINQFELLEGVLKY
ncbi:PH domain-containing protein [Ruminiclostridium herbifermentans]|uniref:PH domain-containing protein n=1 Tax=Ruminiclostridium herbifermentans TaxID=2488810 RepID=A0A4U7JND1_9FIRM|nr:PH domain-containing protein [Ruminiclostridium herbifermentans]QNU68417.1 PH domain-containing protein [Ruminiclostridium herbifermentans]